MLPSVACHSLARLFAGILITAFLAGTPPEIAAKLPLFASLGLADSNFSAKPALAAWDALFARRNVP